MEPTRHSLRKLTPLAILLLLVVGPLFGPVPKWLDNRYSIESAVLLQITAFTIVFSLIAAMLVFRQARDSSTREVLSSLGLTKSAPPKVLAVGAFVGIAWGIFGKFGIYNYVENPDFSPTRLGVLAVLIAIPAGVAEDLVTRSMVMNQLADDGHSKWVQVAVSAGLFATYHALWAGSSAGVIGSFIFSLVYGLVLAGLFLWSGRSLWPVMLAHSGALLVGEPQLTETLIRSLQS